MEIARLAIFDVDFNTKSTESFCHTQTPKIIHKTYT